MILYTQSRRDDFVYVGGATAQKVDKLNKTDLKSSRKS